MASSWSRPRVWVCATRTVVTRQRTECSGLYFWVKSLLLFLFHTLSRAGWTELPGRVPFPLAASTSSGAQERVGLAAICSPLLPQRPQVPGVCFMDGSVVSQYDNVSCENLISLHCLLAVCVWARTPNRRPECAMPQLGDSPGRGEWELGARGTQTWAVPGLL